MLKVSDAFARFDSSGDDKYEFKKLNWTKNYNMALHRKEVRYTRLAHLPKFCLFRFFIHFERFFASFFFFREVIKKLWKSSPADHLGGSPQAWMQSVLFSSMEHGQVSIWKIFHCTWEAMQLMIEIQSNGRWPIAVWLMMTPNWSMKTEEVMMKW